MQNRLDSLEFVVSENKVCNIKIKDDINHFVKALKKVEKPAPTFALVTAASPHSGHKQHQTSTSIDLSIYGEIPAAKSSGRQGPERDYPTGRQEIKIPEIKIGTAKTEQKTESDHQW